MSFSDEWFDRHFEQTRVMVIVRGLGPQASLQVAESAWAAGVRAVEVPVQRTLDVEALRVVAAAAAQRGHVVGAGTVTDPAQVATARLAGAAYTVSPGTDEDVIRASLDAGLPTLPGVATASDIQRCARLGLRWLKAFPADQLGPGWFMAMRGPFPDISFVATGGLNAASGRAFLDAGARVLAMGSAATANRAALDAIAKLAPVSETAHRRENPWAPSSSTATASPTRSGAPTRSASAAATSESWRNGYGSAATRPPWSTPASPATG